MPRVGHDTVCGVRRTHKEKEKPMTDPNENGAEQRTWTPDPDSRGVPNDPFETYFGKSTPDPDGPDI